MLGNKMDLEKRISEAQIIAVYCNQWGDTGKGKIVDLLAGRVGVVARGTGGNNAGHTVMADGQELALHLIPAGIMYDSQGTVNILGNGMVIDVRALCSELDGLDHVGLSYNNLMVAREAHVVMPYHVIADRGNQSQKDGGIGTTGRGIGPCYADKIARRGIMIGDLFDEDKLRRKIKKAVEFCPGQEIDAERIIEQLKPYVEKIKPLTRDTVAEMHRFVSEGRKILLEGAQGLLLSIEHGTYPNVTSSDCSLNGLASGVGLSARAVDLPLGIVKFPFMTRVGGGAFPTEFGGRLSEDYCAQGLEHDVFYEVKEYLGMDIDLDRVRRLQEQGRFKELAEERKKVNDYISSHREDVIRLMNNQDPFLKGAGIRIAGFEFGTTTARPRRTGWTDAVAAKYAVGINGPFMILTKLDSVSGIDEFRICYGYEDGDGIHENFDRRDSYLRSVKPVYATYKGYDGLREAKSLQELPREISGSIVDFEEFTGGKVVGVSNGPKREQMIWK
jgi:adenylosuccinate synthase